MKQIFTIFLSVFLINTLFANPIDKQTALLVAGNFYQSTLKNSEKLTLAYECISANHSLNKNETVEKVVYYYVFNSSNGFVMVAGDDAVLPILGYSTSSTFDAVNIPENVKKWFEGYKQQINYIITNQLEATPEIKTQWEYILKKQVYEKNTKVVNALVTTKWNQSPYVNDMCPYDQEAGAYNGYHCVSGCPATAMAQIMKYWNYPQQGTGFHQYSHGTYGNLAANFGATTYNWAAMPNEVNSTNAAVALLMYHCGVAVEMDYGPTSSGSYVIIDYSPSPEQCSEYAYKTYFGYNPTTLKGVMRENYTDSQWKTLLKTDLDNGRPIQYAGFGQGGHTFVCDGYDASDRFHMNWGWGGMYDGYFLIDALNPGSGGTGSGAGSYNAGQQAVLGIQPPSVQPSGNMELYASVSISPNPITFSEGFTVTTNISNGSTAFSGDLAAALFDSDNSFISFIQIYQNVSMPVNSHFTNPVPFTTTGILAALPGTYKVGIFSRPTGGNWQMIDNGAYQNLVPLTVEYENAISIYKNITVSTGDITQNQPFSITTAFANESGSTFIGEVSMSLFNMETGDFIMDIDVVTETGLNTGYYRDLTFVSDNGINIAPGTYLLAGFHMKNGGSWELSGSQYKTNPIKVIVKEAALQADAFENNDTQEDAYSVALNFSNSQASFLSSGANSHKGDDLDYYELILPQGYAYTIHARAHDSYNSGNGNTYTNDVAWSYLHNNIWSEVYDDVMPTDIVIPNGGNVILGVAPYFVGSTGTYLLDVLITRGTTQVEEIQENHSTLSVYPNPAHQQFFIDATNAKVQSVKMFDVSGKNVLSKQYDAQDLPLKIETNNLKSGIYFLEIETENLRERKKIIIE